MNQSKFLLDSGNPEEYKEILNLAKKYGGEIWGATTNPTLIAKKLEGEKISPPKAYELQKQIVMEIISLVPGAVSAEVYADQDTKASEMIEQGKEIATWHKRIVVKLPTTIEGFKARTVLRKEGVPTNNTLVFSQEQIFAICLHEQVVQKTFGPIANLWPSFISPFVGRLDDKGEDGMALVENGMKIKQSVNCSCWMLEASVRRVEHLKRGLESKTELITAPAKVYREWFLLTNDQKETLNPKAYALELKAAPSWNIPPQLLTIKTIDEFMNLITGNRLNINHLLTDIGIARFAQDWKTIIKT